MCRGAAGTAQAWVAIDLTCGGNVKTVRDIMTAKPECARASDTLVDAARKMKNLDVGALPICGDDERLIGMITDRDIVVGCVAAGSDPYGIRVEEYASMEPVTIGADDTIEQTLCTMAEHGLRRLPVIDGHDLIGIVSQADVARNLPVESIGQLVEAISTAPAN
jgi:CBS domain-containing protein